MLAVYSKAVTAFAVILLAFLFVMPANSQTFARNQPATIQADELRHDDNLGVVTAKGSVEIVQGERILFADAISFQQKTNTVSASGNVVLLEPTGETLFADYMELTDDLRDGVIKGIKILLTDDSRFAALQAKRTNGRRTTLSKAVYSPCKICEEEPEKAPLWQLKADKIIHDQNERHIYYRNAFLELFGVPVAYTPYFSHPDPTVDRKSGFLTPSFGSSGNLGPFIQIPYFWVIDQSKDVTFSPIYTRDEGVVFSGEYRQKFNNGQFEISGSLAEADRRIGDDTVVAIKTDEVRGHLFTKASFDLSDIWRAGFDINRASDRSYLNRFEFFGTPGNTLKSNAYAEGFWGRNYAAANAYAYQDLRGGQQPNTPIILPMLDYNYISMPAEFGGRFSIDANFRSLYRADSTDSQRASLKLGYEIPFISDAGFITTVTSTLQSDLYYVARENNTPASLGDGFTGRVFPQLTVNWRYPFVREMGSFRQIVEPVAAVVLSPNGSNPEDIPSEDSVVVELDDTNLFSSDRFPGIDRVESGQRVIYGLNMGVYGNNGGKTTAFVGQSYRIHADSKLANEVGIENHRSDLVGRVRVEPNPYIRLLYRFRAGSDSLDFKRNEVGFSVGPAALRLSGDYIYIDDDTSNAGLAEREELRAALYSKFHDYWSVSLITHQDLADNGGTLLAAMVLTYEDECFRFSTTAERSFTRDADFEPSDSLVFRLTFKHLGVVEAEAQ